ncbi:MAG TPA: peptide-binding protein [Candidatus Binatia bacterium]|jgi:peptide/nickel transport system substrate-binding protein|nr:peptide-binding protein [Candidatus Binatia bacterium]
MMSWRAWRFLLALPLLIGCGDKTEVKVSDAPPAAEQVSGKPVTGDWLVIHSLSDPEQLNPLTSSDASSSEVLGFVFESLLTREPKSLELKPLIAEARPEISQDKLTYTFKIRKDALFQDGKPLTGQDVLFSVKAIKCPFVNAPFLRVYFNSLINAELVDPYTIRFVTKEPYFLNESVLGGITLMPRHYYDPENLLQRVTVRDLTGDPAKLPPEVKKFGDQFNRNFNRNPLGSGPYKFSGWKTGSEIELTRNVNYWGNGKEGLDQPRLDRLKFRVVNNMDAALTRLKSGSLDYMEALQPVQHVRGTSSDRFRREFKKYEYYAPTYTYIGWNNEHPIFRDKRVRRAMTYLTDRKQIVKSVLFGLGEVVDSPIYFFRPEYDKTLRSYPFDPQKAVALLNEAGWRDTDGDGVLDKVIDGKKVPLRFEIKVNSGNAVRKSVALVLLDELKKHGIAASVRELDWTIFLNDVKNHQFDAVVLGWQMSTTEPDAYQVWHSSQAANKGSNAISYKNARVDEILEVYRREFDAQKRIQLYNELQRILHDEQPYTFLYVGKRVSAVHRRFQGVEVFPDGLRPIDWWVPVARQKYVNTVTAQ